MKKEHLIWGLGGVLVGVIFAAKLRQLPVVKSLPTV